METPETTESSPELEPAPPSSPVENAPPDFAAELLQFSNQFETEVGRRAMLSIERRIEKVYEAVAMPGVRLNNVECRETLCKMSVTFDDISQDHVFYSKVFIESERGPAGKPEGLSSLSGHVEPGVEGPDGKTTVTVFLVRK